ncbi:MAG: HEPN domain-containing protein, partial [Bacteroidetes bacterium]|nr:HEPN domain-containing protein [Bacteroidota bacterium]
KRQAGENLNVKYGKILRQAFESRTESDYRIFTEFTREELSSMLADAKDFIAKMKEMLK